MQQFILIIHVIIALALLALVLVQHGKGADAGASFGSGAANTMFGSVGPASFLMKLTGLFAAIFFATSIVLVYLGTRPSQQQGIQFNMPTQQQPTTTPSTPVAPQTGPAPTSSEDSFAPSSTPSSLSITGTEQNKGSSN